MLYAPSFQAAVRCSDDGCPCPGYILSQSDQWLADRPGKYVRDRRNFCGDHYAPEPPSKLARLLRKRSNGTSEPAPIHLTAQVAIVYGRTCGGLHLHQIAAMSVDNDVATFVGVPAEGTTTLGKGTKFSTFRIRSDQWRNSSGASAIRSVPWVQFKATPGTT